MNQKKVIIIGGGPAGLTAAYELLEKTDLKPIILEATGLTGGIARTINYKGNRIDIGGHRFFSKSDTVMDWWQRILPIQRNTLSGSRGATEETDNNGLEISYHGQKRRLDYNNGSAENIITITPESHIPDPELTDKVMLIRSRLSRIFYLRKFFNYPISLEPSTITNLGLVRMVKIGTSYMKSRLFPLQQEESLEHFFINRFGTELYHTFFKDYTEKVWGVPCNQISAEWGAQRVKGLSVAKAIRHALKQMLMKKDTSLNQKATETSLIERFLYPKYGPGQMWEEVARLVQKKGGEIHYHAEVTDLDYTAQQIKGIVYRDPDKNKNCTLTGDFFFSTMPVRNLIAAMGNNVPSAVREVASGLMYRDFMTVGLLLKKLKVKPKPGQIHPPPMGSPSGNHDLIPDNWIYIQERDVKVGRLQIFNNWSPYMISDPDKVWIGLEYFCNEGDELWNKPDKEFIEFAKDELVKIDIIEKEDVLDSVLIRQPKTYPAYFGTYGKFGVIRNFVDSFRNLFLVGRNGMHKYNNMDHSMLTAMVAVDNIIKGYTTKENIWAINTEEDYHEEKQE